MIAFIRPLIVAMALSACSSYIATDGTRFGSGSAAARASAERDLRCARSARVVETGHHSGHPSSAYWRVSGCGREVVYGAVAGGFNVWQLVVEQAATTKRP